MEITVVSHLVKNFMMISLYAKNIVVKRVNLAINVIVVQIGGPSGLYGLQDIVVVIVQIVVSSHFISDGGYKMWTYVGMSFVILFVMGVMVTLAEQEPFCNPNEGTFDNIVDCKLGCDSVEKVCNFTDPCWTCMCDTDHDFYDTLEECEANCPTGCERTGEGCFTCIVD